MSKMVRLFAIAVLGAGLMTGCSSSAEPAGASDAPAETTAAPPLAVLEGTYEASFGPTVDIDAETTDAPTPATWAFRSTCDGDRCTAVAVPQEGAEQPATPPRVFDFVDGAWVYQAFDECTIEGRPPGHILRHWTLAPQPDGTLTGTAAQWRMGGCKFVAENTVTLKKAANATAATAIEVPDPRDEPPRVTDAPALALNGLYNWSATTSENKLIGPNQDRLTTKCDRTGTTCATLDATVVEPGQDASYAVWLFRDGAWTDIQITNGATCGDGSPTATTQTSTMRLPNPVPNPITFIEAQTTSTYTGSCATTKESVQRFERLGD